MQLEWKKTANEYMIENKRITNQMGDLTMAKIAVQQHVKSYKTLLRYMTVRCTDASCFDHMIACLLADCCNAVGRICHAHAAFVKEFKYRRQLRAIFSKLTVAMQGLMVEERKGDMTRFDREPLHSTSAELSFYPRRIPEPSPVAAAPVPIVTASEQKYKPASPSSASAAPAKAQSARPRVITTGPFGQQSELDVWVAQATRLVVSIGFF